MPSTWLQCQWFIRFSSDVLRRRSKAAEANACMVSAPRADGATHASSLGFILQRPQASSVFGYGIRHCMQLLSWYTFDQNSMCGVDLRQQPFFQNPDVRVALIPFPTTQPPLIFGHIDSLHRTRHNRHFNAAMQVRPAGSATLHDCFELIFRHTKSKLDALACSRNVLPVQHRKCGISRHSGWPAISLSALAGSEGLRNVLMRQSVGVGPQQPHSLSFSRHFLWASVTRAAV